MRRRSRLIDLLLCYSLCLVASGLIGCAPDHEPSDATGAHVPLPGLPIGRITAGQLLAEKKNQQTGLSCIDCHGQGGQSPANPLYPRIGSQYDDYLAYALLAYRQKTRRHPVMQFYAQPLTNQEIADLAVYFGAQPPQLYPIQ